MTQWSSSLPRDLQRALAAELAPGERLLYAGQPDWRAEWGQLTTMFLFGFGWMSIIGPISMFVWSEALGFPLTPPGQVMGRNLSLVVSVFLIPFALLGLTILAAPFLAIRTHRRSAHAVTDTRILTLVVDGAVKVASCKLDAINFINRRDGKDGFGSLAIGYGVERDSEGDPRPLMQQWPGIPAVRKAEAAIRENARWVR